MCEFCNIKKGDMEVLVTKDVDIFICKNIFIRNSIEMYIGRTETDEYNIISSYFTDNDEPVVEVKMPIKYCPECGRKLHSD